MKSTVCSVVIATAVVLLSMGPTPSRASETPASYSKGPTTASVHDDLRSRLVGSWEADGKVWTFTRDTVSISGGPGIGADETPYHLSAKTVNFTINGSLPVSFVVESISDAALTATINQNKVVFKRVK